MALARVALVTGAARGIGRGIALRLASDGLNVAVNDIPSNRAALISVVSEIEALGRRSSALTADVSDEKQVKNMIAGAVEELGGLDVMVANAGICKLATLLDTSPELLESHLSVNVRGMLFCYKHAAEQMIKQGRGGRIIGAASVSGLQGSHSLVAYCTSKFAVRGLTQSSAVELAEHGITVNAYAPGTIDTPMLANVAQASGEMERSVADRITTGIPVGRIGQPEDIAQVVSFFASEKSGFVTGQTVSANGGIIFT